MIITCEKCSKTFNIQDKLVPDKGRLLQCGNCNHKWFFKPIKKEINQKKKDIEETLIEKNISTSDKKFENKIKVENQIQDNQKINIKNQSKKTKKKPKIIKNTLVILISIIAIIILLDTFKYQLEEYIPNLNLIMNNLYESLKDLFLFFKDLIN